jgi:hypothetical protein
MLVGPTLLETSFFTRFVVMERRSEAGDTGVRAMLDTTMLVNAVHLAFPYGDVDAVERRLRATEDDSDDGTVWLSALRALGVLLVAVAEHTRSKGFALPFIWARGRRAMSVVSEALVLVAQPSPGVNVPTFDLVPIMCWHPEVLAVRTRAGIPIDGRIYADLDQTRTLAMRRSLAHVRGRAFLGTPFWLHSRNCTLFGRTFSTWVLTRLGQDLMALMQPRALADAAAERNHAPLRPAREIGVDIWQTAVRQRFQTSGYAEALRALESARIAAAVAGADDATRMEAAAPGAANALQAWLLRQHQPLLTELEASQIEEEQQAAAAALARQLYEDALAGVEARATQAAETAAAHEASMARRAAAERAFDAREMQAPPAVAAAIHAGAQAAVQRAPLAVRLGFRAHQRGQ